MACNTDYTPKPKAFIKLDFPEKVYEKLDVSCSFIFEFPVYSQPLKKEDNCSMELSFPLQDGVLHMSYYPIKNDVLELIDDSRKRTYHHNLVGEGSISNSSLDAHGMFYDFGQGSAKAAQFYLTDSVNHFFFGALYFKTEVCDSILPINIFLKNDILHLIKTFRWKDK